MTYLVNGNWTCNPCAKPYFPGYHTDYPVAQEPKSFSEIPKDTWDQVIILTKLPIECNDCGIPVIVRD